MSDRIIEYFCPRCQSIERELWPPSKFGKYERIETTCIPCVREIMRGQGIKHETTIEWKSDLTGARPSVCLGCTRGAING